MVDLKRQGRLYRAVFVIGGGLLLLFANVTLPSAALQNWPYTYQIIDSGAAGTEWGRLLAEMQTKLDTLDTSLNQALQVPKASLNDVTGATTAIPRSFEIAPMHRTIREMNEMLKQVSSENGVNLDVMYESIDETTTEVDKMQDNLERLKVLMDVNREIAEKLLESAPPEEPVIKTWFESGSIILRILVVNPSQTETQSVPVKVYLPKEVSPKDIIDLGDLKLDYDPEMGTYYVHNSVELGPGESMTKMVEMEDIWVFKEEQLSSLVNQAKEMASQLEGTPYAEEAAAVVLGIEAKLQEILERQEKTVTNAGEHIRAYRQGTATITAIKEDLSLLEGFKQVASGGEGQGKGVPADDAEGKFEGHQEIPSPQ